MALLEQIPSDLRFEYIRIEARENRTRLFFIIPLFGIISLIYLVQNFVAPSPLVEKEDLQVYQWIFTGGIILSLLFIVLLNFISTRDNPVEHFVVQKLFLSFFLTWIVFLAVNDLTTTVDLNAFIIGVISAAIVIRGAPLFTFTSIITTAGLVTGGTIALSGQIHRNQFIPIGVYTIISLLINIILENARMGNFNASYRLKQRNEELKLITFRDHLTKLYNRRYIMELLENINDQMIRTSRPFALIILDVDNFKKINNLLGHALGDSFLQELALVIQSKIRIADMVGRYGGEEFILILPDTKLEEAGEIGERLRRAVEELNFQGIPWTVTISLGCGEKYPSESLEGLIARVDRSLLQAKSKGRNRLISNLDPQQ